MDKISEDEMKLAKVKANVDRLNRAMLYETNLTRSDWKPHRFIYFRDGVWRTQSGYSYNPLDYLVRHEWVEYEEPQCEPEMTTWVKPKVQWYPGRNRPYMTNIWYRSKKDFFEHQEDVVVYGDWETMEAPANREDWESE